MHEKNVYIYIFTQPRLVFKCAIMPFEMVNSEYRCWKCIARCYESFHSKQKHSTKRREREKLALKAVTMCLSAVLSEY